MCGVKKDTVFMMLTEGQKPVVLRSATERLQQVIETQNLLFHGQDRMASLKLAKEYYKECLLLGDWTVVEAVTRKYLDIACKENNNYLRYLILSLLDVLEEKEQTVNNDRVKAKEELTKAFSVYLDFTSSKGLSLNEVYERAGSKDQFLVILKFLWDHPRCVGDLREAVDYLMKHVDDIDERKMCA